MSNITFKVDQLGNKFNSQTSYDTTKTRVIGLGSSWNGNLSISSGIKPSPNLKKVFNFNPYFPHEWELTKNIIELGRNISEIIGSEFNLVGNGNYKTSDEQILDNNSEVNAALVAFADTDKFPEWWSALTISYPFSPDFYTLFEWSFGEGERIMNESLAKENYDLVAITCFCVGNSIGGWSNEKIDSIDFFKNKNVRVAGFGGNVMRKLGANVIRIGGNDLIQSFKKGDINFMEYSSPSVDISIGIDKVAKYAYVPSIFENIAGPRFILFKRNFWNSLTNQQQKLIRISCNSTYVKTYIDGTNKDAEVISSLEKEGRLISFPDSVISSLERITSEFINELKEKYPDFSKVLRSINDFATFKNLRSKALTVKEKNQLEKRKNGTPMKVLFLNKNSLVNLEEVLLFFNNKKINIEGLIWSLNPKTMSICLTVENFQKVENENYISINFNSQDGFIVSFGNVSGSLITYIQTIESIGMPNSSIWTERGEAVFTFPSDILEQIKEISKERGESTTLIRWIDNTKFSMIKTDEIIDISEIIFNISIQKINIESFGLLREDSFLNYTSITVFPEEKNKVLNVFNSFNKNTQTIDLISYNLPPVAGSLYTFLKDLDYTLTDLLISERGNLLINL